MSRVGAFGANGLQQTVAAQSGTLDTFSLIGYEQTLTRIGGQRRNMIGLNHCRALGAFLIALLALPTPSIAKQGGAPDELLRSIGMVKPAMGSAPTAGTDWRRGTTRMKFI